MNFVESKNSVIITENQNLQNLGTLLQRCLISFNNLVLEYQDQQTELENYKKRYIALKHSYKIKKCEKCINFSPSEETKGHAVELPELVGSKSQKLQTYSTRNAFRHSPEKQNSNCPLDVIINDVKTQAISIQKHRKEGISPTRDIQKKDQSVSDSDEMPTGKCSPVFSLNNKVEKKKLSNSWKTPESKIVKLSIPPSAKKNEPGRKLKQARFNFVHTKTSQIIDASNCSITMEHNPDITASVKVEPIENDDTILPSPTSGPVRLEFISRNLKKNESSSKFFKSKSKVKYLHNDLQCSLKKMGNSNHIIDTENINIEEEFIDLLHPKKIKHIDKEKICADIIMEDDLDQKANANISPLQQLEKIDDEQKLDLLAITENSLLKQSENRIPLMENINCDNIQTQFDTNASVSLLKPVGYHSINRRNSVPVVKKENVEYIYKEPTQRKKAEKKALPGWKCDQCKNFYGALHRDDPVMLEKRMLECSKHRGRTNPIQPETPPGLWEPRWHVEEDTEVFNKQNDVT